jgi:hypothetical protein
MDFEGFIATGIWFTSCIISATRVNPFVKSLTSSSVALICSSN